MRYVWTTNLAACLHLFPLHYLTLMEQAFICNFYALSMNIPTWRYSLCLGLGR